jgi:hypothetical protein
LLTSLKQSGLLAAGRDACQNVLVADNKSDKSRYVDNGWPVREDGDEHAVSEVAADRTGALSPYGDITFPLPAEDLPYTHPVTIINK